MRSTVYGNRDSRAPFHLTKHTIVHHYHIPLLQLFPLILPPGRSIFVTPAGDGTDKLLVPEHLSPLPEAPRGTPALHLSTECPFARKTGHDLIDLGGGQGPLTRLGRRVQQGVPQLGQIDLAAVVVIEGGEGGEQLGARGQGGEAGGDGVEEGRKGDGLWRGRGEEAGDVCGCRW